jgi:hypothetical protein
MASSPPRRRPRALPIPHIIIRRKGTNNHYYEGNTRICVVRSMYIPWAVVPRGVRGNDGIVTDADNDDDEAPAAPVAAPLTLAFNAGEPARGGVCDTAPLLPLTCDVPAEVAGRAG